ncbi:MAG: hypothetical protein ABFS86_04385 [Planctomycetota bacterium]
MSRYLVWLAALLLLAGTAPGAWAQEGMDPPAEEAMEEAAEEAATEEAVEEAAEAAPEEAAEEAPEDIPEITEDPSEADEGGENIDSATKDFMESTSEWLDDNAVFGVVRIRTEFSADLIYDSNIWLNDEDERDTRGEVDDFILRLFASVGAEMKVNSRYTKIFKRDRVTLIKFDYTWNKYFENDEVTNSNWNLGTDLFGFLSDLLSSSGGTGTGLYYRVKVDYSDLTDPMDLIVREAFTLGFPVIDEIDTLRRTEILADLELGWIGNSWDIALGYKYYRLEFNDDLFASADNTRNSVWGEFGLDIGARTRAYVHGEFEDLEFPEQALNDAEITSIWLGLEGLLFSKKIRYDVYGGITRWDPQYTGLVGDRNDFDGGTGWLTIVYMPWEEKKLSFQVEGGRKVDWSAISNYRIDDSIMLSIRDEIMPKRLSYDLSAQYAEHEQSLGPRWTRLELGAGLIYTPNRQMTISLRYLYRDQDSDEDYEIVNVQASLAGGEEIATNGNFIQHMVSFGVEVRF